MSFALLIIGITLIVAAVQNTHMDLTHLVAGDFSGPNNFLYWVVALVVLGGIGFIPKLKGVSTSLIVLVMLVLILYRGKPGTAEGGFFQKFVDAIKGTETSGGTGSKVSVTLPGTTPFPGSVSS